MSLLPEQAVTVWILIGDVSGHGVPAGLVMMMCQTAVRTLLDQSPGLMPDALLTIVNAVLTRNIHQLGEDKYMTITALRRDHDGTVYFAGAHQEICLFRALTGKVETFETQGMWLGFKASIAEHLETRSFRLDADDVLFLYTDGITEAHRNNALFDTKGLRSVIATARGKTANEILEELFKALEDFQVSDDATFIVIRRLEQTSNEPQNST